MKETFTRRTLLATVATIAPAAVLAGIPLDADVTRPLVADDAELLDLWRERVQANSAWDAIVTRSRRPSDPGYRRWNAEYEAAADVVHEIDEAILATPAVTAAGMVIKARIAAEPDMGDTELDLSQQALQSLLADLERLAGEARS